MYTGAYRDRAQSNVWMLPCVHGVSTEAATTTNEPYMERVEVPELPPFANHLAGSGDSSVF